MKLKLWYSLLLGLFISNAIAPLAQSQISPDGTTNTIVNQSDNTFTIDEGDRSGANLFHSFEQFSVINGSEAFFNNPNDIVNIFSRVTGGDISNIDGLIRANGDASLFLINPAGIIFGEGASLNIGGSFFGSTAESIFFADDVEFSATDGKEPLLTINQPLGLNYGSNPGNLAVNSSNLQVNNGETLALLGGDVTITGGQIIAPGGNIELGGITAAGRVNLIQLEETFNSISFPEGVVRGDITLTNGAEANVQGVGGGNIRVNARNLELSNASNLTAGIASQSNLTQARAGDITINATENITVSQRSFITNNLEESGVGNGGDIKIATNNLSLTQGSKINSSIFGIGNGGEITIKALDTISIDGETENKTILSGGIETEIILPSGTISGDGETEAEIPSGIFSQVRQGARGNSGEINITTTNLELTGGGRVDTSTLGEGDAGRITIDAVENISANGEGQVGIIPSGIFSLVSNGATGNSGDIEITTSNLKLTRAIVSNSTFGQGNAGQIIIDATENIEADGASQNGIPAGILSIVIFGATGDSGDINITTSNLKLTRGAAVSASTAGVGDAGAVTIEAYNNITAVGETQEGTYRSGIFNTVDTLGVGNSGNINITTTNLELTQGGEVNASTFGQGNAGKITLEANGTIEADGESSQQSLSGIFSRVEESAIGDSNGIDITTNNLFLTQGGTVDSSTTGQGNSGKITLEANGTIEADGENSEGFSSGIFSIVEGTGRGNAGGIDLTTTNLSLIRGGQISASTFSQGNAGKITLEANGTIEADGETSEQFPSGIFSRVESEAVGNSGGISITTTDLFLIRGSLVEASTSGEGNAGKISLSASSDISASGESSEGFPGGIFSIVEDTGQGNGANIEIDTSNLSFANGAEISVESLGQGNAGSLSIQANTVALSNGAALFASTPIGTGGNIKLQITEDLTLEDNSTISAEALENANGGNITIDADFVIAGPNQNNDLIASAEEGIGGDIDITTNAIFGLQERSSIPENDTNDLDASSELGVDGTIQINELETNPTEGLEELPQEVIDVTRSVAQNLCQQGRGSEFVIIGKGGNAPSPTQARDGATNDVDLVEPVPFSGTKAAVTIKTPEAASEIIEAKEWIINDRGMVELVAHQTKLNASSPQPKDVLCHKQ